jgi:hypothetical protein
MPHSDNMEEIQSLAREALAIPGLRKANANRIVTLGLDELRRERESRGMRTLGPPPPAQIQAAKTGRS